MASMDTIATRLVVALLLLGGCSDDGATTDGPPADLGVDASAADVGTDTMTDATPDLASPDALPDTGPVDGPRPDTPPTTGLLRVATFNCYCLKDSPATRAKGIAEQIKQLDPHVVGLQEVCQSLSSGGSDNFAKTLTVELQALTGKAWEFKFAKTHVSWSAYDEGVGLLAPAGQLLASGEQSLPQGAGPFPRKVIWAKVGTSGGPFYFYSTHLTISSNAQDRENQAQAIVALASQHATTLPQVVVGDFNDWYGSGAVNAMKSGPPAFTDSWGTKNPGSVNPGLTCCYPNFGSRIDYVFVKTSALSLLDKVELAFDAPYQGVQLSDHRGIFVQFKP